MKLMFVCSGNTCRSPMAEYIFKDMLKKNNITGVKIKSSGLNAAIGEGISDNTRKVLKELGIKNITHKANQFEINYIDIYDYIIVMTERHKMSLPRSPKILSLNDLTGCGDIQDPYMGSYSTYRDVSIQLINSFNILLKKGFFNIKSIKFDK